MKKLVIFFLFSLTATAQTPVFTQTFGSGTGKDQGNAIATDASGNIYVTGAFSGEVAFGTQTITSQGESDIFLVKYNSSGTVLWAKRAGSTKEDIGKGITVSGTSVYIVGHFRGTANFNTPAATGSNEIVAAGSDDRTDIFIAKYDDTGTLQWAKQAGSIGFDYGNAIATNGNEVYITGNFEGTATFENLVLGNQIINTAGYSDIFIAKYNELGECQWAKRAGSSGNDEGNGIAISGSSVYITGSFTGAANFNTPSNASINSLTAAGGTTYYSDIFVTKYNNTGVFQWAKRAGSTDEDIGYGIAVNGSSVYITGSFNETADFNTPSNSSTNTISIAGQSFYSDYSDIFIAKFNDVGTFQWAKRAGSQSSIDEFGYAIAVNGSSVYITGSFVGTADFNTPSNNTNTIITGGIFIAKYNDSGTFQWARRAGSNLYAYDKPESAFGIVASNSAVMIVGNFLGIANFNTPFATGSNEITSKGEFDIFVAKFNDTGIFQWAKSAGIGDGIDIGRATATDAAGNVYITGDFNYKITIETTTLYSAGKSDIFVAKYNKNGILQWIKRAGGIGVDRSFGIAVSGTSVYVTGYFKNTANFNTPSAAGSNEITSAGSNDIFLAQFNDAGTFQWAKRAGGDGINAGFSFVHDYDKTFSSFQQQQLTYDWGDVGTAVAVSGNDVYITGSFMGIINFNTPSASGTNEITSEVVQVGDTYYSDDIFIAKYNEAGVFQWAKRAGGANGDVANGIAVNGNSIYITGQFNGTANFNTPSLAGINEITAISEDIFIAKYNDAGIFQWAKRAGGDGVDGGLQIAVNGTSIYITGGFAAENAFAFFDPNYNSNANFNTPSSQGSNELISGGRGADIFIAKYNDAGVFQWARRAGGIGHDVGCGIAANSGSIYVAGQFYGNPNFNTPSSTGINEIISNQDIFIAKYNDAGVFQWAKNAGNQNGRYNNGIYSNSIALYYTLCYISGSFNKSNNFSYGGNNNTKNSNGGTDVFLSAIFDGSLSTSAIAGSPFCVGSNIPVNYTPTGTYGVGNVFTVQLLKSNQVVSTATGTSPISLPIPANAAIGIDYRIRVVASNPAISGTDNGANLSVIAASAGGTLVGGSAVIAGNNSTTLSLSGHVGNVLKWQSSLNASFGSPIDIANTSNSITVNNLGATTYYRAVVQNSTCPTSISELGTITVTAAPLSNNSITISPKGIYSKNPPELAIDTTNIVYGTDAFIANTKAKQNIAIGKNALKKQNFNNAFTEYVAGNIALGHEVLTTTNPTLATNGIQNIGIGSFALQKNQTGKDAVGIGFGALNRQTAGTKNIAMGTNAGSSLISSSGNTVFGYQALKTITFGADNAAFGADALGSNLFGNFNVSLGKEALFYNSSSANTAVGYQAGYSNLGQRNVLIGSEAGSSSNTTDLLIIENSDSTNALIVGNFASDKIGINRSLEDLNQRAEAFQLTGDAFKSYGNGTWIIPSDKRLKTNINYLSSHAMLSKILQLKGVKYQWIDPKKGKNPMVGFIAQEMQDVFPENIKIDKSGYLSATYGNFDAFFVESIKALERRNQNLESTNEAFRIRILKLKNQLSILEKSLKTSDINIQTEKK